MVHRLFDALLPGGTAARRRPGLEDQPAGADGGSGLGVPEYRIDEEGPDHAKLFTATAVVGGRPLGSGDGRSKKEAEQRAAQLAWRTLTAEAGVGQRRRPG